MIMKDLGNVLKDVSVEDIIYLKREVVLEDPQEASENTS